MSIDSLVLNGEQQLELSRIAQSRSLPAGYVFRARLILMLAEERRSARSSKDWELRRRPSSDGSSVFLLRGWTDWIPAIRDCRPRCYPEAASPDFVCYAQTAQGWFHSVELPQAAAELGVSKDAVHRVWKKLG